MAKKTAVCNICECPREITYMEEDRTTGRRIERKHIVQCLGHSSIHPKYWNGSDAEHTIEDKQFLKVVTFTNYQKFFDRLRTISKQTK